MPKDATATADDPFSLVSSPTDEILLTLDESGVICGSNAAGWRDLGYAPEQMSGLYVQALLPAITSPVPMLDRLAREAGGGKTRGVPGEIRARRRDGSEFSVHPVATTLELEGRRYYLLSLRSAGAQVPPIRQRVPSSLGGGTQPAGARDEPIWRMYIPQPPGRETGVRVPALRDVRQVPRGQTTGILNRQELELRLESTLVEAQHVQRRHVLLYLDIDRFRVINEARGYAAGDSLLRQLGTLLRKNVDSEDLIARVGGDSFAVLLLDCSPSDAFKVAERLRQAVGQHRFVWQERTLAVTASVGAVAVQDADAADSLLNLAEVACYAAKDDGRNRIHLYQDVQVSRKHRELRWVWEITRALEEQRFELYFQPIIAVDGAPKSRGHYELLLRMRGEDGRLVPAREFIAAAERYDLIATLDRWVVTEALSRWVSTVPGGYTLAINLSGGSLSDGRFLQFLIDELRHRPLPPGALCFEITETAAISSLSQAAHFMHKLKELGVDFSLDDFGSGLSSFSYLKSLPVDYLKIDGQFVRNVAADPIDRTLVAAISEVGAALQIKVIAECVECREVLDRVIELGVGYVQGYHLCEPRPVAELPAYERRRRNLCEELPAEA